MYIGNFGVFFALLPIWKPTKSEFWKSEKTCWRYHHFTHVHQKPQSLETPGIRSERDKIFCHFGLFLLFYLLNNLNNWNFEKTKKNNKTKQKKNICRCHYFTNVYQKSRSYDVHMISEISRATDNFLPFEVIFSFLPY